MSRFILVFYTAFAAFVLFADDEAFDLASSTARFSEDEARLKAEYKKYVKKVDKPSEEIVVPVENHPDGSLKVEVCAGKAQFFNKDAIIWCGDVIVREFGLDKKLKMELEADTCIIDRNTKSGWINGLGKGHYGKTKIQGRGIYFSFSEEFVKILSNVMVESSEIKFEGVEL